MQNHITPTHTRPQKATHIHLWKLAIAALLVAIQLNKQYIMKTANYLVL